MKRQKWILALSMLLLLPLSACAPEDDVIDIGILQYVTHGALDASRLGFLDALAEAGYEEGVDFRIHLQNPQAEQSQLAPMSSQLVSQADLLFAIATPAAIAIANEKVRRNTTTPLLFTAVTDPVDAGLVASLETPNGTNTGTNDMNPVAEQIALILDLVPDATTIGILYTASEDNSQIQASLASSAAEALGLEVEIRTVTSAGEIQQAMTSLANAGIDALYLPTDNLLASSMEIVNTRATELQLPVVCGESSMAEKGGTATLGINYYELGVLTGEMAVQILRGEATPASLPVVGLTNFDLIINLDQARAIGLTLDAGFLASADRIIDSESEE